MMSSFHIMEPMGQNHAQYYVSLRTPGVALGRKSAISDCILFNEWFCNFVDNMYTQQQVEPDTVSSRTHPRPSWRHVLNA